MHTGSVAGAGSNGSHDRTMCKASVHAWTADLAACDCRGNLKLLAKLQFSFWDAAVAQQWM